MAYFAGINNLHLFYVHVFVCKLYLSECDAGFYGDSCASVCGRCKSGTACNHVTGTCYGGCETGYTGDMCLQGS